MLRSTVLARRADRVRCLDGIRAALNAGSAGAGVGAVLDKLLPGLAAAIGATALRVELAASTVSRSPRRSPPIRVAPPDTGECERRLTAAGRYLGVLYARYPGGRPAADDEALLTLVAHEVALVVDNAILHERDRARRKRLEDFVGMLAHELRTPLAAIASAMDVVARPGFDAATLQHAREVVERQVRYQARLLDDLLDLTRIAHDTIELRLSPVDLRSVVSAAVEVTTPSITQRRQVLGVSLPDVAVPVVADATRLEQVMVNLLANATKYTPVGGRITVSVESAADGVVVRVVDSGEGIPTELLAHVFDPFVQAPRRYGTPPSGLGVGLALVKRLVEAHGGVVEARSAGRGLGSEFVVRLPVADGAAGASDVATPAAEAPAAWGLVLVVEDDRDTRETLRLALERAGQRTIVAATGVEAVERAAAMPVAVMLVDLGLPDIPGYEVARRARALRGEAATLVALSGYGGADEVRRARAAGFDAYLLKPATLQEIAAVVARCRGRAGAA